MLSKRYIEQLPNILTCFRIIFALPLLIIFSLISHYQSSNEDNLVKNLLLTVTILFSLAITSDLIDGYLARKFNSVSEFGKILDPVADKILINITLFGLSSISLFPY